MLIFESTERNDKNNWVKNRLVQDGLKIIEFEGYTIKNSKCTGVFDRRLFVDPCFLNLSDSQVYELLKVEEPYLDSKIAFASRLNTSYRYVFYSYDLEIVRVYRFENGSITFKKEYSDFCSFIRETGKIRDLKMTSSYQEDNLPKIDKIFRDCCGVPWMGNLDAVFLYNESKLPALLVEFQTTIKTSVLEHCNNKYFSPSKYRKGDEQRWKVFDNLASQANLDLVIIVWSPKEVDGNIKYKVVDNIVYSDNCVRETPGIKYKSKKVKSYAELSEYFEQIGLL